MYSLEELEVWKLSRAFRMQVSDLIKTFPATEKYKLTDQLIRASRSIPANIAEGFGRFHYQENIQFCRQARGSLFECKEHLHCALDEGYIDQYLFEKYIDKTETLLKKLNGYISYLKKAKKANNQN